MSNNSNVHAGRRLARLFGAGVWRFGEFGRVGYLVGFGWDLDWTWPGLGLHWAWDILGTFWIPLWACTVVFECASYCISICIVPDHRINARVLHQQKTSAMNIKPAGNKSQTNITIIINNLDNHSYS